MALVTKKVTKVTESCDLFCLYYLIYCDIISLLRSQQKILYEQGGSKMRKLNEKFTELTEMELIKTSGGGIWGLYS